MAHKTKIGGTAYEIAGGRTLVGGTAYGIDKGRTLVDGTGYDISFGTPIGSLAVGSSVFFNVNGTPYEFIVVHQGNPDSSMYDASCDGTWVLMKNVFKERAWNDKYNDYENSYILSYLKADILNTLDSGVKSAVKQVKIPYHKGNGYDGSVRVGSAGLSTQVFLLSGYEIGWVREDISTRLPVDGACLDYFIDMAAYDSGRVAYLNGKSCNWWLRSPNTADTNSVWLVWNDGDYGSTSCTYSYGERPAFILPSDFDVTNYLA